MMKYYLIFDPELKKLKRNKKRIKIFMKPLLFSVGKFESTLEELMEIDQDFRLFHSQDLDEAIFVFFIRAVDHWVTLIAHKQIDNSIDPDEIDYLDNPSGASSSSESSEEDMNSNSDLKPKAKKKSVKEIVKKKKFATNMYLFDSRNQEILYMKDYMIMPNLLADVREGEYYGLSIVNRRAIQNFIHSIFDIRRLMMILTDVIMTGAHLNKYYVES